MQAAGFRLHVDDRDVAALRIAQTFAARSRGLLGTRSIEGALLIRPCNSVHGMGMTYPLDVALLDETLRVRHVLRLRPFGLTRPRRGIRQVLEAQAGAFTGWGLTAGSRLAIAVADPVT